MRRVVDTNVAIVANGRSDAARGGRRPCIDCLEALLDRGQIVVDQDGDIQAEYRRHLHPSGQPGVGDQFYRAVLNDAARIRRMRLQRRQDGSYAAFPDDPALASFDASDRKFAAVARLARVAVANAVDSDWLDHREALKANGIKVHFVCRCDPIAWFED